MRRPRRRPTRLHWHAQPRWRTSSWRGRRATQLPLWATTLTNGRIISGASISYCQGAEIRRRTTVRSAEITARKSSAGCARPRTLSGSSAGHSTWRSTTLTRTWRSTPARCGWGKSSCWRPSVYSRLQRSKESDGHPELSAFVEAAVDDPTTDADRAQWLADLSTQFARFEAKLVTLLGGDLLIPLAIDQLWGCFERYRMLDACKRRVAFAEFDMNWHRYINSEFFSQAASLLDHAVCDVESLKFSNS
ncbi:hypothetical protein BC831DRAFT_128156 [Entophlyctis helioformis]|nr:hypothetical protein BC831DRAFT_128156 [Entophlyctis helioformis]